MTTREAPDTDNSAIADTTTGADATMALLQGLPGFASATSSAAEVDTDSDGGGDDSPPIPPSEIDKITAAGDAQDGTPAEPEPVKPAAAGQQDKEPPKDQRDYMQRLAARDRKYEQLRQEHAQAQARLQELDAFDKEMRSGNRVAALHSRYKLSLPELNRQWLDMGDGTQGQPGQGAPDLSGLPPEMQKALGPVLQKMQTLEQQNAEFAKRQQTVEQREQQLQQQQARQAQVGLVAKYVGDKGEAYAVVNDLGLHDQVFERVVEHVKLHGEFETDADAAFVIDTVAAEVEQAERAKLRANLAKPAFRKFLLQELGAQKEAKPARQETRAPNGRSNTAAPAVPNSLATQRASRGKAPSWRDLPIEEQLQRTTELAIQQR